MKRRLLVVQLSQTFTNFYSPSDRDRTGQHKRRKTRGAILLQKLTQINDTQT